jgi:hypothetical protein
VQPREEEKGGKKKGTPLIVTPGHFNEKDYLLIMGKFKDENFTPKIPPPPPVNGLGWQAIGQYKAVIMAMHQEQVDKKQNGNHWDHIWGGRVRIWSTESKLVE